MNYEIIGWLLTILAFVLVGLLLIATWVIAVENGYDKGFKNGYKRGANDYKQSSIKTQKVTFTHHPSLREKQLVQDNDYLMDRVVSLFDRENN